MIMMNRFDKEYVTWGSYELVFVLKMVPFNDTYTTILHYSFLIKLIINEDFIF